MARRPYPVQAAIVSRLDNPQNQPLVTNYGAVACPEILELLQRKGALRPSALTDQLKSLPNMSHVTRRNVVRACCLYLEAAGKVIRIGQSYQAR